VLTVLRKGVLAELQKRIKRDLEVLTLVVRFDNQKVRRDLLQRSVERMSPLDLLQFKQVAKNMVEGVASTDRVLLQRLNIVYAELEEVLPDSEIERRLLEFCEKAQQEGQDMNSLEQMLISLGVLPAPKQEMRAAWPTGRLDEAETSGIDKWRGWG
jgi:hypothetical protein